MSAFSDYYNTHSLSQVPDACLKSLVRYLSDRESGALSEPPKGDTSYSWRSYISSTDPNSVYESVKKATPHVYIPEKSPYYHALSSRLRPNFTQLMHKGYISDTGQKFQAPKPPNMQGRGATCVIYRLNFDLKDARAVLFLEAF